MCRRLYWPHSPVAAGSEGASTCGSEAYIFTPQVIARLGVAGKARQVVKQTPA